MGTILTLSCKAKAIRPTLLRERIASHACLPSWVKTGTSSGLTAGLGATVLLIIATSVTNVTVRVEQLHGAAVFFAAAPCSPGQKATTPSTMNPLNCPPFRMSVVGKSRYFWFTYSSLVSTFGVRNQPPPTCERFTFTSGVPTVSCPLTVL